VDVHLVVVAGADAEDPERAHVGVVGAVDVAEDDRDDVGDEEIGLSVQEDAAGEVDGLAEFEEASASVLGPT